MRNAIHSHSTRAFITVCNVLLCHMVRLQSVSSFEVPCNGHIAGKCSETLVVVISNMNTSVASGMFEDFCCATGPLPLPPAYVPVVGPQPRAPAPGLPRGGRAPWDARRMEASLGCREHGPCAAPRVPPTSQAASRLVWCPASHAAQRGARAHGSSQGFRLRAVRPVGHGSPGTAPARRRGRVGCYVASGCPRTASPMAGRRGKQRRESVAAAYDLRLTMLGSVPLWSSAILSSAVPVAPVALFSTWHTGCGSLRVRAAPMSSGS